MNKHLRLLAAAVLGISAGCGKAQMLPPPTPAQSDTTASSSITQNSGDVQNISRSTESTAGSLIVTFVLPSGAQASAAVVYANGTSQVLTRSTTLRLTGSVTIVAVNTTFQGTTYVPTPSSQVKTVYANSTTQATITYAPVPRYGNLNVITPGLPAGAGPNLAIAGPNNWGMSVFRAGVLQNLTPGTYVVTAQPVSSGGKTYAPKPPSQSIVVSANYAATATITYTYTPVTTSFSTQTMINVARTLASNVARYGQDLRTGTTYCNIFVRDFVGNLVGFNPPELGGGVVDQLAAISTSPRWKEITNRSDWNWTYAEAARRAKAGQIVIAVTTAYDAHIVVVMPYDPDTSPKKAGFATLNGGKGYAVPLIAEATVRNRSSICSAYGPNGLDSAAPLNCGFFATQQQNIRFFVYSP